MRKGTTPAFTVSHCVPTLQGTKCTEILQSYVKVCCRIVCGRRRERGERRGGDGRGKGRGEEGRGIREGREGEGERGWEERGEEEEKASGGSNGGNVDLVRIGKGRWKEEEGRERTENRKKIVKLGKA